MTDIILKIYSTSSTWCDTLDHTIYGDVVDYRIIDNSNFLIDTAWFKINDCAHQWSDQITPDHYTGSAESTQVWRAFSRNDKLLGSGPVTKVYKQGAYIIVEGEGMSSLLKRRIIDNKLFHTLDNAGAAISGDYFLMNATYGLVKVYLGSTYGTINDATTTPTTTQTRVWKFDGVTLWDACMDIARGCYGSNGYSYDVYLYEQYTSPSTFALYLYFKEQMSTAKAKTITMSDIYLPSFHLAEHARENFNRVMCRGEINPNATYPRDINWMADNTASGAKLSISLTADIHDGGDNCGTYLDASGGDFVNDGVVAGMYLTNSSDGCFGIITSVTTTRVTCSAGFRDGTGQDFDNGDVADIGYGYVGCEDAGASAILGYATVSPKVGSTSLSLTRTDCTKQVAYILTNLGLNVDSRYQLIRFSAAAEHEEESVDRLRFNLSLGVKDIYGNEGGYGGEMDVTNMLLDFPNIPVTIAAVADGTGISNAPFYDFCIPLPKPGYSKGWEDATGNFSISSIPITEWATIDRVGFFLGDDAGEDIKYLNIYGLHFIGNVPYEGSYPTSAPSYAREYIYQDNGLKSDISCNNMSRNLYNGINQKQWAGNITLPGVKRDFTLKAGNTVEVIVPSKGINIQSGQTPAKLPIQSITYTPNMQTLSVGRSYSLEEVVNNIARKTRIAQKMY